MGRVFACVAAVAISVGMWTGTAAAKTPPPTVAQVNAQVDAIYQAAQSVSRALTLLDMPGAQTACQSLADGSAALEAMARPTRYPKATWKLLMKGAALSSKSGTECLAAAQAGVANFHSPSVDIITPFQAGLKDFGDASIMFSDASKALQKAKIS